MYASETKNMPISAAHEELVGKSIMIIGGSIGGLAAGACLVAAGFNDVIIMERTPESSVAGAGVGLDDASVAILAELVRRTDKCVTAEGAEGRGLPALQTMRWVEERLPSGEVLRQPYPYFAAKYIDLVNSLTRCLPTGMIKRGCYAEDIERLATGRTRVHCKGKAPIDCDVVIAADGARSRFRHLLDEEEEDEEGDKVDDEEEKEIAADGARSRFRHLLTSPSSPASPSSSNPPSPSSTHIAPQPQSHPQPSMRYAGYTAWRGTVSFFALSEPLRETLRNTYSLLSNCSYLLHGDPTREPRQSAVLYDIGDNLLNWLVYVNVPQAAAEGTTTNKTPPHSSSSLLLLLLLLKDII